jgi:hypothetical protein
LTESGIARTIRRMPRSGRTIAVTTLIAFALLLPHCARKETSFRHDGHVTIAKGACGRCHGEDPANPRPATTADCAACHRQAADPANAGNYGLGPPKAARARAGSPNAVFSHAPHAGAGVPCIGCHGEKGIPVFPSREECSRCHEKEGAPPIS